jgi:hypothetical protein
MSASVIMANAWPEIGPVAQIYVRAKYGQRGRLLEAEPPIVSKIAVGSLWLAEVVRSNRTGPVTNKLRMNSVRPAEPRPSYLTACQLDYAYSECHKKCVNQSLTSNEVD